MPLYVYRLAGADGRTEQGEIEGTDPLELRAGSFRCSCHLLRHTMATLMLENGAEIRYLQEILGHAQVTTTQLYIQVRFAKLLEVHAATHPASRTQPSSTRRCAPDAGARPGPRGRARGAQRQALPGHARPQARRSLPAVSATPGGLHPSLLKLLAWKRRQRNSDGDTRP
ncbi:MAG: tyrosine-type recombinase/integrase [Candidatus Wallbacteria bacterium]|nr:tyrosine-type recombinase/integrase [Candidatus Wallbacteria bacterium]